MVTWQPEHANLCQELTPAGHTTSINVFHRTKASRITALSLQRQLRKRKDAFKTDTIEGVHRLPARRVTSHTLHDHELQTLSRWSMASLRS